jgi:hypothetical protein
MGIIELTAALNSRYSDRTKIQKIAQETLRKFAWASFFCSHKNDTAWCIASAMLTLAFCSYYCIFNVLL